MAVIRELRRDDVFLLDRFFRTSLSDETLRWQNRFGQVNNPQVRSTALFQCEKDPLQERGYIFELNLSDPNIHSEIIGYGWLSFGNKPTQKYTAGLGLVVADAHQRKGVGTELMRYMIEEAKKLGIRKLWLNCYEENTAARALYKKFLFVIEGRFVKQEWFGDEPVTLVSMAKFLD